MGRFISRPLFLTSLRTICSYCTTQASFYLLHRRPRRQLHRAPRRRLPGLPTDDGVRLSGHIERGAPVAVAILRELKIPALASHPDDDEADAGPRVEPVVHELERW